MHYSDQLYLFMWEKRDAFSVLNKKRHFFKDMTSGTPYIPEYSENPLFPPYRRESFHSPGGLGALADGGQPWKPWKVRLIWPDINVHKIRYR